jgi:hypothetical protein
MNQDAWCALKKKGALCLLPFAFCCLGSPPFVYTTNYPERISETQCGNHVNMTWEWAEIQFWVIAESYLLIFQERYILR